MTQDQYDLIESHHTSLPSFHSWQINRPRYSQYDRRRTFRKQIESRASDEVKLRERDRLISSDAQQGLPPCNHVQRFESSQTGNISDRLVVRNDRSRR